MENLVRMDPKFWHGKSVFLTGHTGFKGGWLSLWLNQLGASVHGYALAPPSSPCLFEVAGIAALLASDSRSDLADLDALQQAINAAKPDVVFHLAAQPLVRESYRNPLVTLASNVTGTAHLLEAVRQCPGIRAVVCVTTDKVYHNREWVHPYREEDHLGGCDLYSASKACSEIVAAAYRSSFFETKDGHPAKVATARAGNVIGGGDWANDRLVPECLASFENGQPVHLRFPQAHRPWQHVLEPLSGYLRLAQVLCGPDSSGFSSAWNFGPDASGYTPVGDVATNLASIWGDGASVNLGQTGNHPHEANLLSLDSSRARHLLQWKPKWTLAETLNRTIAWHKAWIEGKDMLEVSIGQILDYQEAP